MNIKDLKYFHALVKNKNFSSVATEFKVSQPTISMAVRRLEEHFNTTLFTRDQGRHQLSVTLSGQQLDEHVYAILEHLAVAQNSINNINTNKFILGLPPIMTKYFFPRIAKHLTEQNLLKAIVPVEKGSAELEAMLLDGTLDMSLMGSIQNKHHPSLVYQPLGVDHFTAIVGEQSPFFKREKIWFSELKNEKFITFDSNFVHSEAIKNFSRITNFRPNIVYQSNDAQVIQEMVAQNVGVGFIASSALIGRSDIRALPFYDEDQPVFHMNLVQRKDRILSPKQQAIADLIYGKSVQKAD
jgi:LysR family hydrogen peroxide-inducible transcriptional activator